jgi:hypothetical protein
VTATKILPGGFNMLARLRRIVLLRLVPAVAAAVLVTGPAGAGPNDPTVLFGARPEPGNQQGTTALESQIGRKLAAIRAYQRPRPVQQGRLGALQGDPLLQQVLQVRELPLVRELQHGVAERLPGHGRDVYYGRTEQP